MSFLVAENISLQFGGLKAVDQVSFAVERGEIFTIIGPNGAGKTSIFNLISRLYNPTSGRLIFDGEDFTQAPPHRIAKMGIARTFQNIELFDNASVLANLLVGRHCHATTNLLQEVLFLPAVRRAEFDHRHKVEQVIELLDLEPYRDKLISGLPYGVRKVIELARALCSEPRLMLLDEPSSGLERRRDRRHVVLDPRHPQRARHHRADGRARHEPRVTRVGPRAGAQLRPRARRPGRPPRCRAIRKSSPPISARKRERAT